MEFTLEASLANGFALGVRMESSSRVTQVGSCLSLFRSNEISVKVFHIVKKIVETKKSRAESSPPDETRTKKRKTLNSLSNGVCVCVGKIDDVTRRKISICRITTGFCSSLFFAVVYDDNGNSLGIWSAR